MIHFIRKGSRKEKTKNRTAKGAKKKEGLGKFVPCLRVLFLNLGFPLREIFLNCFSEKEVHAKKRQRIEQPRARRKRKDWRMYALCLRTFS